jgi:hypothetical protein
MINNFRIKGTNIGYDVPIIIILFIAIVISSVMFKPKPGHFIKKEGNSSLIKRVP